MHELSRLNVSQSLLGVFWGVWFAQFSFAMLNSDSAVSVGTGPLRGLYVVGALASILGLTVLLWVVRERSERLAPLGQVRQQADTLRDTLTLLGSFVLISGVVVAIPVGSYFLFRDVSASQVALTAAVLPVWLGFVLLLSFLGSFRHA